MINKIFFPSILNSRFALLLLLFGLILGISIRFIMIFFLIEFDFSTGDNSSYIEIAQNIINLGIYGIDNNPVVYRPPMYSFFLASIMYFFGINILLIQIIQLLISLITGLLITRIVAIYYSSAAPWVFLFFMFSPFESVYASALLSENITSFFLVLVAFFLLTFSGFKKWFFAGCSLGLCCLTRDIYILLSIIIIFCSFVFSSTNFKTKFITSFIFIISMFLIILPWSIRNYQQTDDFILISKGRLGYGLWLGTWAEDWKYVENDLYLQREIIEKNSDNTDHIWKKMALERMKEDPIKVLQTYFIRAPLLWFGTRFDIFILNKEYFPSESNSWYFLKIIFYGINLLFIILSIIGAIYLVNKKNPIILLFIPILYTAGIYMPFESFENRYSQPVYPFILIFSSITFSLIINNFILRFNNR